MFFSLSPDPPKSPNLENRLIVSAHEQRKLEGTKGLAGRSCHVSACLHLLCRTSAHLYSRHRQAVTWQPSLNDNQPLKESSPHTIASTPGTTTKMRGMGIWDLNLLVLILNSSVLLFYFDSNTETKFPKVKWVVLMKYNKTHFWKCSCAFYSSLFLTVVQYITTLDITEHRFAASHNP